MFHQIGATQVFFRALEALTDAPIVPPEPPRPDPEARPWWIVLGFEKIPSRDLLEKAHRTLIRENHPDRGGTDEAASRINLAMEAARAYYEERDSNS